VIDTESQAREIAERYLADEMEPMLGAEVVIVSIREYPTCWVVGYNTRAFVENGDLLRSLVGNGPMMINRATGRLRLAWSGAPAEEQLDP
jgi:Immunity protein 35